MSFQAMNWASQKPCKSAAQKLVLLMLANHANGHTGQCNPSHAKLADECCMSVSSLKVQIKTLEELGYLRVIHKMKDGVYLPNQYELLLSEGGSESDGVGSNLAISNDAGLKAQTPATPEKSGSQNLAGGGSESGYKPVIKPKRVVVTRTREFENFELTEEQIECKNWAATHNYWASCTHSDEEFLKVWSKPNGTLRKQFNAHKKALQDGSGQAGLNVKSQNNSTRTGVNYATHYANNKKPTAAEIAKSLRERANAADNFVPTASNCYGYNGEFVADTNAQILVCDD